MPNEMHIIKRSIASPLPKLSAGPFPLALSTLCLDITLSDLPLQILPPSSCFLPLQILKYQNLSLNLMGIIESKGTQILQVGWYCLQDIGALW